jgi:hypothetical protein
MAQESDACLEAWRGDARASYVVRSRWPQMSRTVATNEHIANLICSAASCGIKIEEGS